MLRDRRADGKIRTASCLLGFSLMVTGSLSACSEEPTKTTVATDVTTASITVAETTVETEETSDAWLDDSDDGLPSDFESTSGDLEGMDEYMILRSECGTNQVITDTGVIDDEFIRTEAQYYMDEGYTLFDCGGVSGYGDLEYGFCIGFEGETVDDGTFKCISVWRMNETLFNYFILDKNVYWNDDEGVLEDDGVFVRRYLENTYSNGLGDTFHYYACYEFSREEGVMTFYSESDNPDNWSLHFVPDMDYDDPELEVIAQNCLDAGCAIERYGSPDVTALHYDITLGVYAVSEEYTVYVLYMDEDTFDQYFNDEFIEAMGVDEYDEEDDGTVIRYYIYECEEVLEYDRENGRAVWLSDIGGNGGTHDSLEASLEMIHGN